MSWAIQRRTLIIFAIVLVALAVIAVTAISIFYETPSCADGKENQDEEGIDCGGSCQRLCSASVVPPTVSFVRTLPGIDGRTDIVAYVENPNPSASALQARYTIELYREDRTVIAALQGTVDLPPSSSVPIFIPNAYSGVEDVAQAFVMFDQLSLMFNRDSGGYIVPTATDVRSEVTASPRVTAVINNPSAETLRLVPVVVTVFNAEDIVIAASRTVIDVLPPQGQANIVVTWTVPFSEAPSRIDVRPAIIPPQP